MSCVDVVEFEVARDPERVDEAIAESLRAAAICSRRFTTIGSRSERERLRSLCLDALATLARAATR